MKTGMPASFASWMTGTIDFESHGLKHDRADTLDDEVLHLIPLFRHVLVAADDDDVVAVLLALAAMLSPITLKNGFSSVSSETPIVPLDVAGTTAFGREPAGVTASSELPQPGEYSNVTASKYQRVFFMVVPWLGRSSVSNVTAFARMRVDRTLASAATVFYALL